VIIWQSILFAKTFSFEVKNDKTMFNCWQIEIKLENKHQDLARRSAMSVRSDHLLQPVDGEKKS
jgi:hypothetical protein